MASFKSLDRDPEEEARCLRQRSRSASPRNEWRYRAREALWWATVCAVATVGAFVAMVFLWHAIPQCERSEQSSRARARPGPPALPARAPSGVAASTAFASCRDAGPARCTTETRRNLQ